MPIDMTTVKQIMHGTKEVAKIEDINGNILWQKAAPATPVTITLTGWLNLGMGTTGATSGYIEYTQLTSLVAPTGNPDKFIILPASTVQAIKNHTYTTDQTITGLTITEWYNSYGGNAYVCYIQNNDLYCVGNTDNSTANDTVLGTTNVLSKFRMYYPYNVTGTRRLVFINNTNDTSTTKWRFSNSNYLINHTNYSTSQKVFLKYTTLSSASDSITYYI